MLTTHDTAAVITGIGSALPSRVVTNEELSSRLDTSDEWIRSRTGIRARHVIDPGMATSDLGVAAGEAALKSAEATEVDAVLLATTTPDRPCPATAPDIASRLGLGVVPAFDISAVCSGFVYGLAVGGGLITGGIAGNMLVIGADTCSTILNPEDRNTTPIFGDGAGAVVLRASAADELGALGPFDLGGAARWPSLSPSRPADLGSGPALTQCPTATSTSRCEAARCSRTRCCGWPPRPARSWPGLDGNCPM